MSEIVSIALTAFCLFPVSLAGYHMIEVEKVLDEYLRSLL